MTVVSAEPLAYCEPVPIVPVRCHGLARVDRIDGEMFFTLYAIQQTMDGQGFDRIINLRVEMPVEAVREALPEVISLVMGMAVDRIATAGWKLLTPLLRQ